MTEGTALPLYLKGRFAPVPEEHSAFDLTVRGTLPPELDGRYLRNGPNPLPGEDDGHWFTGPGMLHGIRLREGRAEWYRNRWIRTREREGHPFVREDGTFDLTATPGNTHVIRHADTVLALCEAGFPYRVTPALETVGPYDFGGRLTTAMTAHPKEDPVTGELHLFGTGFAPPYLTYHRVTAEGELVDSRPIEVPGPTMTHDFAITGHHIVWMDLPVVFRPGPAGRGGMPYQWDDGYGARHLPSTEAGPEQWLERSTLRDWVWEALEELSPALRLQLVLRHFTTHVTSYERIAAAYGIPVGTVRSRLTQGRTKLAAALAGTADTAHGDTARRTLDSRTQARETLAAAESGHFGALLTERWSPEVALFRGGDRVGGRDLLVRAMDGDIAAGVRQRLVQAIAGRSLAVWEMDIVNPADDPGHCPPAVAWLMTLDATGRVHRLRLFHPQPLRALELLPAL
ncbi:carotenoid oxygenase family protein [Streptomyces sp. NPDC048291]|uniref:carotenoid oxygenase family protein n=1 Tax=Streptomyces sp. NPDC048291 TaxID=3365530 RepID=UPI0037113496